MRRLNQAVPCFRHKIMLRKIITYFLIIAVVLPVFASAVPSVNGVKIAKAEGKGATAETSVGAKVEFPCEEDGWGPDVFPTFNCIFFTLTKGLYIIVMWPAIWIAGLASGFFNISIQFSLTGDTFDAEKNIMIKEGWILIRDLLNLVFIFILLAAAISTILQHGGLDIKKVLPSLIVVALLVNFSLMIAKMVIDASHIFAWEFYNQIDVTDGGTYQFANSTGSVESNRLFTKKNLAGVFLAGFNPQQILVGKTTIQGGEPVLMSPFNEMVIKAREGVNGKGGGGGKTFLDIMPGIIIIILSEAVLAIYAAFILLAGAIMFILRVVVLWLVMIFSPIAFFGMILPSMQKYSGMWWKYLIDQSFFAPAFLFMFMLVTKFINSDFIDSIFKTSSNSDLKIVLGLDGGAIVLTLFHFLVVAGLMMACLIVAKQLGGKTAEFGIGGAHRIKGWALSAPGKALKYGQYGVNNRLGRWAGGLAGDSNWFAKSIGRIPGGNILGRKLGAMKKADEDKARKAAEKYAGTLSSAGRTSLDKNKERSFLGRVMYGGGVTESTREGYENVEKKKNAEQLKKKTIKKEEIELSMLNKAQSFLDGIAEDSKQNIKIIDEDLDNIETELQRLNYELIEAVKNKNTTAIPNITIEINKEKVKRTTKVKEKELHTENIKNAEHNETKREALNEKAERRGETEGLQETIKASGVGGVGGKGGGGKTTP